MIDEQSEPTNVLKKHYKEHKVELKDGPKLSRLKVKKNKLVMETIMQLDILPKNPSAEELSEQYELLINSAGDLNFLENTARIIKENTKGKLQAILLKRLTERYKLLQKHTLKSFTQGNDILGLMKSFLQDEAVRIEEPKSKRIPRPKIKDESVDYSTDDAFSQIGTSKPKSTPYKQIKQMNRVIVPKSTTGNKNKFILV